MTSNDVFDRKPLALLEIFLIFQKNPDLKGVRASTIRLIRDRRHLINNCFRADPKARQMFMKIMRQPRGALRRMNRYGILARYLPPFNWIVGRMQYDLFHVYTVDEHILCTIYNLRRFAVDEYKHEFPLCSECMSRLEKPELLYLGGLFHDIAKGRGGNHSLLGAEDARAFGEAHGLSGTDTDLVVWLVRKHLLMSITAQRKDISDPEVIWEFAKEVGNPLRLDYLYLLTVADIRATDPKIWNSWKNSLLRQLYTSTRQALLRGLWNPQEREEIIQNKQAGARHLLVSEGIDEARTTKLWMKLSYDYFLFHTWDEIAWHSKLILTVKDEDLPLIRIRKSQTRGGTEVFIYCLDRDYLFVHMTSLLDQLGTNIVSAQIETTDNGYTLNSFLVLEEDGGPIVGQERTDEIVRSLRHALSNPGVVDISVYRRVPRQLKFFPTPTRIDFGDDLANHRTVVKLVTDDRPGLLSQVGDAFSACDIRLTSAKIATIGAEVEDTFFITDRNNHPLTDKIQFDCLEEAIRDRVRGGLPGV